MLIQNAEIWGNGLADLRIANGLIVEIGTQTPRKGEKILDADGGVLLPGLHDHHIHMAALAAKQSSLMCGPPEIMDAPSLAARLAAAPGAGWLRGIGYHESVAGMLDAAALDKITALRPVRIQHRSGRMWFLNSAALEILLQKAVPPQGLEKESGRFTGRLFDEDSWLRQALQSVPPGFSGISRKLASFGVTGITDMSPSNDLEMARHFIAEQKASSLLQSCLLAGTLELKNGVFDNQLRLGPAKLHLHEADLPPLDDTISFIRSAHDQGRSVAIHCATETELVFALSILEDAGTIRGDRIEHASVAPDPLIEQIARMGLWVTSQPHFITERGDQYRQDVAARDLPSLYRLKAFVEAGITLGGGSDAPFGGFNPWDSMQAAVTRKTRDAHVMGASEALTAEEALSLFLSDPEDLSVQRQIAIGGPADLCLLKMPWTAARGDLSAANVRATIIGGSVVYDSVDQTPA